MFKPEHNSATKFDWQIIPLYRVLISIIIEILPTNSNPQQIQIAALSACSLVHGLTMLILDGPFSEMQKNPKILDQMIIKTLQNCLICDKFNYLANLRLV